MPKKLVKNLSDTESFDKENKLMVLTDIEKNTVENISKEKFIENIIDNNEENAILISKDSKLFVIDATNADNINQGTINEERLKNSGVVAGSYNLANLTINEKGIITNATQTNQINTNLLADSGVVADTYEFPQNLTVDRKGRITGIVKGNRGTTPIATPSTPGIVQPDTNTLQITTGGIISAQSSVIFLGTSGTQELTDQGIHAISPTDTVELKLPQITDNSVFHQMLVQINLKADIEIDLGIKDENHFIGSVPEFKEGGGLVNVRYEFDANTQEWYCEVIPKGALN